MCAISDGVWRHGKCPHVHHGSMSIGFHRPKRHLGAFDPGGKGGGGKGDPQYGIFAPGILSPRFQASRVGRCPPMRICLRNVVPRHRERATYTRAERIAPFVIGGVVDMPAFPHLLARKKASCIAHSPRAGGSKGGWEGKKTSQDHEADANEHEWKEHSGCTGAGAKEGHS